MELTSNKTYEYIKTNLDVITKWLEFNSEFNHIKGISTFDFVPKIYEVREQVLEELKLYLEEHKIESVTITRKLIITMIADKLNLLGYSEATKYLTNIDEQKQNELITSLFVRRSILSTLSRMEDLKLPNDSEDNKLINTYLNNLRWLRLSTTFEHSDFSENIAPIYLQELAISEDESKSTVSYLQEALFYIKRLEILYGSDREELNILIEPLEEELDTIKEIASIDMLIEVLDNFDKNTRLIKENSKPNVLKLTSN